MLNLRIDSGTLRLCSTAVSSTIMGDGTMIVRLARSVFKFKTTFFEISAPHKSVS